MSDARLLTIPEAARRAGLTEYSMRAMVKTGDLPTVEINGRQRINSEDIRALLTPGGVGREQRSGKREFAVLGGDRT